MGESYKNYCKFNPEIDEEKFFLITTGRQIEILTEFIPGFLEHNKGNFKGTYKSGVTGIQTISIDIKTPGKSLRKALKNSPYLHDSHKREVFSYEDYNDYALKYFIFKFTTEKARIEWLQTKYNIDLNKIGLLGRIKDKEYKKEEDFLRDLKKLGFTDDESNNIKKSCLMTHDTAPYEEKKVILEDKKSCTHLGSLYNSLSIKKIKIEQTDFEKSNIMDLFSGYITKHNLYIFEDVIYRILKKFSKFYICASYHKFEDIDYKKLQGEYSFGWPIVWPAYILNLQLLFDEWESSV